MKRTSITLAVGLLTLFAPLARPGGSTDSLTFFNNWFVTGDYAVSGVGLRGLGNTSTGLATGTINMTGIPSNAQAIAAFLYWSTAEPTSTPGGSIGYFNKNKIQGAVLGNPNSPNPGCTTKTFAFVYRADVLRYLPVDSNNNAIANGSQTVALPDVGSNPTGSGINTNGASLVVIYKLVVPGLPTIAPLRAVVIYNGAYTLNHGSPAMTQTVAGFYQAMADDDARITGIVANGQRGFSVPLSVNGQTLSTNSFDGAQGTRWDNPSFNINLPTNATSFSAMATAGGSQTCVTWAAIVASTAVQDSDNDGLLDLWETKGLHRNTQVFPATFGTCSDYPGESCVNLPAMGANPNKKDIFLQIDWMHGTGGGGGTDGFGTHDHIPLLSALSDVATVFATNGINLHFDVGAHYQGSQATCGNAVCSFIVPANVAGGGSDIDESTLVCKSTQAHPCNYSGLPYPVLSFEYGFASVRDGNSLLGIPAHFAQNRKDIFHYALFAHALAGPFNAKGQPVNPFTLQPTNTPLSYSGIAHRPGGGFMVTLGLWRSDIPANDQVGSEQVQAGTLMHELGHNLELGHAGLATTPNCIPSYPSVMNYLYQTRGLTDSAGSEHLDYSYGVLLPMSEKLLSTSIPMALLPGLQRYRVRYYGPLAPGQPSSQASQVHCDGTPLAGGAPFEVRLEGPKVATPDWSNGTEPLGHLLSPQDVNYDGTTGQTFLDQPDWFVLNLQQIGTGYSFGGLSVGSTANSAGAYATDGGAFATDAGALATDAGAFATDGGAFATDAGAFATDGGAFATDAGALATDGGAFATDAGELDEVTVLLSSVDSPTPPSIATTINSNVITFSPPSVGMIASYNIYRCAGAGCTPVAPAFRNVTGGTPSPSFTDLVNDTVDAGATCPAASTCYNTTYVYSVTSVAQVNSSLVESLFSTTVTGQVNHLFVLGVVPPPATGAVSGPSQTYVYGTPAGAATYAVYGNVASSLTSGISCVYSTATPRNVGTYTIICSGPATTSATDGVTYNAPYLSNTSGVLTISQRPITVTAAASSKTYDGLLTSPVTPTITAGTLAYTDTPNFVETYDTKNVGTTHTVTASGTVNDLNAGNNYKVTFVAINTGIITPAPQSITFGPLPDVPLNTPDFVVSATASSGLPVMFAAAGNCSVNGSTVHLTATGSCSITASQGGGGNYLAASTVTQSFTVTPESFVISDFRTLAQVGSSPTGMIPTATPGTLTMTTQPGQTSAAWYPTKLAVANGFTTQFTFQISPTTETADGFAFVIQNSTAGTAALGDPTMGGYLGYQGISNSLAIEFDTYKNDWDPDSNHVAIQSNGTAANTANHKTTANLAINSLTAPMLADGNVHTVVITYDGPSTLLTVTLDGTPVLSASYDLNKLVLDSGNALLGFTAATGEGSEVTNILSWSFTAH